MTMYRSCIEEVNYDDFYEGIVTHNNPPKLITYSKSLIVQLVYISPARLEI